MKANAKVIDFCLEKCKKFEFDLENQNVLSLLRNPRPLKLYNYYLAVAKRLQRENGEMLDEVGLRIK